MVLIWWSCAPSWAQTTITCVDAYTSSRLDFSVRFEGQVYTSDSGRVQLDLSNPVNLRIESEGYMTEHRTVEPGQDLRIHLFPRYTKLSEVVVTDVHRIKDRHETVLNVSKISAKRIEEIGAFDLRDALTFENNIRINRDNALGSSGLTLMGLGGNNVKIMIDGVPVIGRLFDQVDLEQFSLAEAQQIEVIKGPMSVIYGSNALAGTINIIRKNANQRSTSIRAGHETDGQYNLNLSAAIPIGSRHQIGFSGTRLLFDGWSEKALDRTFDWIPKVQYTGIGTYRYQADSFDLQFRSEYMDGYLLDRGAPLAPYGEFAVDQHYRNLRWDQSLKMNWLLPHSSMQIVASNNHFKRYKNKYYKDLVTLSETLIPLNSEQDTQQFNASLLRAIYGFSRGDYETLLGLDANTEVGYGPRILDQRQVQSDIALFSSTELTFGRRWIARFGARYAYNTAFASPLLYSAQFRWNMARSQVVKLAYGKGFRAPSLKERYLDFNDSRHDVYGNADLQAETSHSTTASYQKFWSHGAFSSNTEVELFYNYIHNKIDLIVLGPLEATYGNIGRYETVGGNVNQQFSFASWKLGVSYSHTGIYNGVEGQASRFTYTPQWVIQPGYTNAENGWSVNLFINAMGALDRVFEDSASGDQTVQRMAAYSLMDLTANKSWFSKRLQTTFGIRNLGNTSVVSSSIETSGHSEPSSSMFISPGRTYFITIRYAFIR